MFKKQGRYKVYSVRRAGKSALPVTAVLLSALALAVAISVVVACISSCGDKNIASSSSSKIAQNEASSTIASEEENIVSSSIANTETSDTSYDSVSSAASKPPESTASQSAASQTSTATNNYGLSFDVYAAAENWTYVVDKSKPVPLQPLVSDDFFKDAMFVGDSITTGIDLYGVVKNSPVIAYTGINTNTVLTRNVIRTSSGKVTFLQAMKQYNPKHIYIMMGINGIAFQSKDNLINGYSKFIDKVKAQHPNAIIYLQSILPVTAKKQQSDSRFANSKIDSYNAAIAQLATQKGVYYLNVAECFKDSSGNLPSKASSDGIHFGTGYYKRWIEYLKRHTIYTGVIPTQSSSEPPASTSSAQSTSAVPSTSSGVTTSQSATTSQETTTSQSAATSTASIPATSPGTSSEDSSRVVDVPSVPRPPKDSSTIATTE